MTDKDLATLVREHVNGSEPPFPLHAESSMALGRRTIRRRRTAGAVACAAAVAAGALVVPGLLPAGSDSPDGHGIDPATTAALRDYDAQKMPQLLREHVGGVLSRSVADLGPGVFTATDSQDQKLPAKYYDKASSMSIAYGAQGDHQYRFGIAHSAGEAEGNARKNCANDLREGLYFSCTVGTTPDGDVITSRVGAVRRYEQGWSVLTPEELRTGKAAPGDPSHRPIVPSEVFFQREAEVVHSKTFLSYATETVRAPTLKAATSLWKVPPGDLQEVTIDPVLVIPEPPIGEGNCPWTLPGSHVSCGVSVPESGR